MGWALLELGQYCAGHGSQNIEKHGRHASVHGHGGGLLQRRLCRVARCRQLASRAVLRQVVPAGSTGTRVVITAASVFETSGNSVAVRATWSDFFRIMRCQKWRKRSAQPHIMLRCLLGAHLPLFRHRVLVYHDCARRYIHPSYNHGRCSACRDLAQTFALTARLYKVVRFVLLRLALPDSCFKDFVAFVVVDCGKESAGSGDSLHAENEDHGGCRGVKNRDPVLLTLFLGKGSRAEVGSMQQLQGAIDARVAPRITQLLNEGHTPAASPACTAPSHLTSRPVIYTLTSRIDHRSS